MNPTPTVLTRFALAGLVAAVACALAAAPAAAGTKRDRGLRAIAELKPFPGQTERGMVQLSVKPRSSGIIAILIGLAADPSDPSGNTYSLRLSRRSCASLRRNPARPLFRGPDLLASGKLEREGSSGYLDDTDIVMSRRTLRGVKSIILGGPGAGPHACGRLGLMEEEGIFYY
jgi:hypothetical protein